MQVVTTVGLYIAKSVFQVHGVDAAGQMVIRRQLKRRYVLAFFEKLPPCLVGIEACASSHHWSRELRVLGHSVKLIPPAYVKPYVKRQPSSGLSLRSDARVSRRCSILSPIQLTSEFLVIARACLAALGAQLCRLKEQILEFDRLIMAWHRSHEASRPLDAWFVRLFDISLPRSRDQ
jgi:transposase